MSFEAQERSRAKGRPVSLYFFRYGETGPNYYAYTNSDYPVRAQWAAIEPDEVWAVGEIEFKPIPISHGAIRSNGTLDKSNLPVRMPRTTELADRFLIHQPSAVVTLAIFDGHVDDPEFKIVWRGRVLGPTIEGDEAVLACQFATLKRMGLRRNWQKGCPHVLYGNQCRADRDAASITVPAGSANGAIVNLPAGWETPERRIRYLGGIAEWVTADGRLERRSIIQVDGSSRIILSGEASEFPTGSYVKLSLGCAHNMTDCEELHNNILNYGGQPWIPDKTPTGIVNNFY